MEKWAYGQEDKDAQEEDNDQFCAGSSASHEPEQPKHGGSDSAGQGFHEDCTHQHFMSRKQIEETLHQILADVKDKRQNDLKILSDVRKEIMAQATRSCNMLQQYMNNMHEIRSRELDKQVVELKSVLSKCQKLEVELDHSKNALSLLCKEILNDHELM